MKRELHLITALGKDTNLILELLDFLCGNEALRYREEGEAIRAIFTAHRLTCLHLICTREVEQELDKLQCEMERDFPGVTLHRIDLPCDDIACTGDDQAMRELVYAAVRNLSQHDLVISSGGRKQVTQRLIEAGLLYGCMGYLTITAPFARQKDPDIRKLTLEYNVLWTASRRFAEERRGRVIREELGDNFRSLYLLPANLTQRLTSEKIGVDPTRRDEDLAWLKSLPKADLHCHLGGAFDAGLLKEMAARLLDDLGVEESERQQIRLALEQRLGTGLADLNPGHLLELESGQGADIPVHPLKNLDALCRGIIRGQESHATIAVLVDALSAEQIEELSWHDHGRLNSRENLLDWYMACGDLGGSSLLQSENTLRLALEWLMRQAQEENVSFLEVRFSPDNYTRAGLTIRRVIEILLDEARRFMAEHPGFRVNFLIMATRHKSLAAMEAHVAAAVTFGDPGCNGTEPRITGFDLAGQEEGNDPGRFQDTFMPLHRHFLNITIHAGEMAEDDKIWQAIYQLHARRIGHGLKLINNRKMMGYVRDYGIAIEMCPSSNMATNGFAYPGSKEGGGDDQRDQAVYPLKTYLDEGIAVTVNTDNRGISRTTLSEEYLHAARLTRGGLSRWEILRLVKNGFKAAFLPKDEKDRVLKEMDRAVFELVLDDFFPEGVN